MRLKVSTVPNLINRHVRFKLRDVAIPLPEELITKLYGEQVVEGKVVDVSDCGAVPEAFAVVQLPGAETPVVVPVNAILSVEHDI